MKSPYYHHNITIQSQENRYKITMKSPDSYLYVSTLVDRVTWINDPRKAVMKRFTTDDIQVSMLMLGLVWRLPDMYELYGFLESGA